MAETTVSYQCPNCGAPLSFHPGDARVVCAHCHTELDAAALEERYRAQEEAAAKTAEEKEAAANAPDAQWSEEERAAMQVQTCSACGAELVSNANTIATSCAYCGSPNLLVITAAVSMEMHRLQSGTAQCTMRWYPCGFSRRAARTSPVHS